ncbi:MAG: hypothetical protein ACI4CT_02025 [Lachnospiraceae bacterium]
MKKQYLSPEIQMVKYQIRDVITMSTGDIYTTIMGDNRQDNEDMTDAAWDGFYNYDMEG